MFKHIVSPFGKPDIDLFASRINYQLSNYIPWRPDPGAKAVDAFSINWLLTYNYCFPPFRIILKVLQKIQQDEAQAIVVVPYWTTENWFLVLLGMLVIHPLIMTASLNIYLPTHPTTPSASQVKTSSGLHIWGNIDSQNVSTTTQYILLSSWRISTRRRYNSALQQWHDSCGREETKYLRPDVTSFPKFFSKLYEKGCQYSSITLAHGAPASVVTLRGYAILSDNPLIKHFIKGVLHLRPPNQNILLSGIQIYY